MKDHNVEEWQHFRRVEALSALMARVIGWTEDSINDIRFAALYHHLDQSRIPEATLSLNVTDYLNRFTLRQTDEYQWRASDQDTSADEAANIIAIADRYDRLTSDQHYRTALTESDAIKILAYDAESDSELLAVEALRRNVVCEEEISLPKAA